MLSFSFCHLKENFSGHVLNKGMMLFFFAVAFLDPKKSQLSNHIFSNKGCFFDRELSTDSWLLSL